MVTPGIEVRMGGLFFTSKFDSGNLARVERVTKEEDVDSGTNNYFTVDVKTDYEFNVWTRPDCDGTQFANGNRSWFYFGVRGGIPGRVIKINIMNMNKQGKLYSQGHSPLVKTVPGKPKWERIRDRPTYESVENNFILSFTHRFLDAKGATTYFAFCYPWSYQECQDRLGQLDTKYHHCSTLTPLSHSDSIYYHRELLCYSLDKLRVDLITISSCAGIQHEEEERFDQKLFPDTDTPRCKQFKNKRVYFVSSRVHPGETPASFVFNGFLDFVLNEEDPRAKQLRSQFVIKLIPILNPDGVMRGHYRTDARGVNLNRMYTDPSFDLYPSIYASKAVLVYHHVNNRIHVKKVCDVKMSDNDEETNQQPAPASVPISSSSSHSSVSTPRRTSSDKTMAGIMSKAKQMGVKLTVSTNSPQNPSKDKSQTGKHLVQKSEKEVSQSLTQPVKPSASEDLSNKVGQMCLGEELPDDGPDNLAMNSSLDVLSGGEFGDPDDTDAGDTEHLGNEGSDEEPDFAPPATHGVYASHLSDPKLLEIKPNESGIALYVDLHGHASKRGCFIYGNCFDNEDSQAECMLFPKLISMNTAHFDFAGCNFTERNMYLKDKREGLSKEGSGRVAMFKALGIINSFTLECNYNTGRIVNNVAPAHGDGGRATPPPVAGFPPKYTQAHFEEVGKAMAIAALDLTETNPWSRLTLSDLNSLHGVREWLKRYARSLRGMPRGPSNTNRAQRAAAKASGLNTTNQGAQPFVPRVAFLTKHSHSSSSQQQSDTAPPAQRASQSTTNQGTMSGSRFGQSTNRKPSQQGAMARKELGPVREPLRGTVDRNKRRTSNINSSTSAASSSFTPSVVTTADESASLTSPASAPVTLTLTTAMGPDSKSLMAHASATDFSQTCTRALSKLETSVSGCNLSATVPLPYQFTGPRHTVADLSPHVRNHPSPRLAFTSSGTVVNSRGILGTAALSQDSDEAGFPHRQTSATSSNASIEAEKIQQLQKIQTLTSRPNNRVTKPLEPPRSDPMKRKNKKQGASNKRRAASYSPQNGKIPSATSSAVARRASGSLVATAATGAEVEVEKKATRPTRRRKSLIRAAAAARHSAANAEAEGEDNEASKDNDSCEETPQSARLANSVSPSLTATSFQQASLENHTVAMVTAPNTEYQAETLVSQQASTLKHLSKRSTRRKKRKPKSRCSMGHELDATSSEAPHPSVTQIESIQSSDKAPHNDDHLQKPLLTESIAKPSVNSLPLALLPPKKPKNKTATTFWVDF